MRNPVGIVARSWDRWWNGEVRWAVQVFNQADEAVAQYDLLTMNAI